jgi:predicted phage terminase large subunit-like protein
MDGPAPVTAVREMSRLWPYTFAKLIEDKANGPAVIQMLQHEIPGILAVNPEGGKMARAAAVSPVIEAGNVYLPHPQIAPWVTGFIEECAAFPNGAHDDQVDAATQALLRWAIPVEIEGILVYDGTREISRY